MHVWVERPPKKPISLAHTGATIHAERKGIFTSPTAKAVFLSINIKVNEGWGPVIYMSRLILMCPR